MYTSSIPCCSTTWKTNVKKNFSVSVVVSGSKNPDPWLVPSGRLSDQTSSPITTVYIPTVSGEPSSSICSGELGFSGFKKSSLFCADTLEENSNNHKMSFVCMYVCVCVCVCVLSVGVYMLRYRDTQMQTGTVDEPLLQQLI